MPSGVVRLKMAKKYHTMPIAPYGSDDQGDLSGLRGMEVQNDIVLRKPGDKPAAPKKYRPFGSSMEKAWKMVHIDSDPEYTRENSPPKSAEWPLVKSGKDGKKESRSGGKRGHSKQF